MGEEVSGGWDQMCQEWLVDTGYAYAGGLLNAEDGMMYGASPVAEGEGWGYLYCEDFETPVLQDDGETMAPEMMNEPSTIIQALTEGRAPKGMWIGGVKHNVVQRDSSFESGDYKFNCVIAARPKGGAHLVQTPGGSCVVALFDETLEQSTGNCRRVALAFAEYLASQGY